MPRKPVGEATPAPSRKKVPPLPQQVTPADEVPVAVAEPIPTRGKKKRASAFDGLAGEESAADRVRSRRPRKGGMLVPLIVMGVLLLGGGVAVAIFWPQLKAALTGQEGPSVAENEQKPPKPNPGEPKDRSGLNKDLTVRDKEEGKDKDAGMGKDGPSKDPFAANSPFPRRALIISVHNYLYANPVGMGFGQRDPKVTDLVSKLNTGLKIPLGQIAHLSDAAGRGAARPPLKSVIEKSLTDFLAGTREQDRVMVFLIGHCAEIEDKLYFVPIEGELEDPAGLIPMTWILEQMGKCTARQRILVADINRENPAYGKERPASGPMSEKLAALFKTPPEGVQVWSACSKDGLSYEPTTQSPGIFIEGILSEISKVGQGKIQRQPDLIPVEGFNDLVNKKMKDELEQIGLKQVAFVTGKDKDNGSSYDPKEAPKEIVLASVSGAQSAANIAASKSVLEDIAVPPVKVSKGDNTINYAMLPPMLGAMADYAPGGEPSKLREKIKAARAVLWAVSDAQGAPADLKALIAAKQKELKVNLSVIRNGYNIPSNENQFKTRIEADERQVAVILGALTEALDDLKDMADQKAMETKRWQANYDYIVAHVEAEIAYLYEYQSMLGQMRKELPPYEAKVHNSFQLASRTDLTGDSTGKKMAKSSAKTMTALAENLKGTPWEVLAKREKLTALGLEWKASKESVAGSGR
jgi:hypothetical protein